MADIRKVVDFPTPEVFKEMGDDIIGMSKRLPLAATGIADIVAAAGQSGIAREELLDFAEIAAKVSVAWDMTAGTTGEALAKIKTQLSMSVAETSELADAINHLSNTSASSAPNLVEYMKRIAATGDMAGMTYAQTAALGSAMIASGAEAEVAATSFRNVVKMMSKGGDAAERQRDAFFAIGMNEEAVAKAFGADPTKALREVLVALSKIEDPAKRMTAAFGVFGEEARGFMPLIANIDLYDKALASVSQKADYLGSSQREYEERAKTTANAMQLFSNQITAASIAIGEALNSRPDPGDGGSSAGDRGGRPVREGEPAAYRIDHRPCGRSGGAEGGGDRGEVRVLLVPGRLPQCGSCGPGLTLSCGQTHHARLPALHGGSAGGQGGDDRLRGILGNRRPPRRHEDRYRLPGNRNARAPEPDPHG